MVQNLDGYCPFELKVGLGVLGAGLGVQGAQAVRRAALGAGAGRAGRAGRAGAGRWRAARAGGRGVRARQASGSGAGARRRQGRAGAGAAGAGALGRAGAGRRAGARQDERERGWASGRAAGRTVLAGHGQQATRAQPVRAGWASWARLEFCAL